MLSIPNDTSARDSFYSGYKNLFTDGCDAKNFKTPKLWEFSFFFHLHEVIKWISGRLRAKKKLTQMTKTENV